MAQDPLDALDRLVTTTQAAMARLDQVQQRAAQIRRQRAEGRSFEEIVRGKDQPLILEQLTRLLDELADASAAWRRAEARALRDEGLSQAQIAELFGVTRQRIGALLAPPPPADARRSSRPRRER